MSDISNDVALGEAVAAVNDPVALAKNFDFESWLQGARSPRTSVRVFQRPDLQAELDRITAEVDGLSSDAPDEVVDRLAGDFERVKAEMVESAVDFVIEKRSSEWVKNFRIAECEALGTKHDAGDPVDNEGAMVAVNLAQLAEQIVEPKVSAQQLARLYEVHEVAVIRLASAMHLMNKSLPSDHVESPGFLRRRSAGTSR